MRKPYQNDRVFLYLFFEHNTQIQLYQYFMEILLFWTVFWHYGTE